MCVASFKDVVVFDVNHDVQIAARTAHLSGFTFAVHFEARTCINTRRNLYFQGFVAFTAAFASAPATDIADHFTAAATTRTGAAYREKSLLAGDLPGAATSRALNGRTAFGGAVAVAQLAYFKTRHANFGL